MKFKFILFFIIIFSFFISFSSEINIIENNKAETFFINKEEGGFEFAFSDKNISGDIMLTLHSINCKVKINFNDSNSEISDIQINQKNEDIFSFKLKKESIDATRIIVTPLMYSLNEKEEENYKNRTCPIVITNFIINEGQKPTINIKDISYIYFDKDLHELNLDYNINNHMNDDPLALSFSFNRKTDFEVKVTNDEGYEILEEKISNSTNLFFDPVYLDEKILHISIKHIDDNIPIFVDLKMIPKTSISIMEQNNLNLGFIASNITYQYYYMEVFKDQEGEIMLHNKRHKGILIGKLMNKSEISNLNDINIYPHLEEASPENLSKSYGLCSDDPASNSYLKFNPHSSKMYFDYTDTSKCEDGCYLLISYQRDLNLSLSFIGVEYTILSRVWNDYEFSPQIIKIPFNEYILGSFDMGSITHHYFSIFIPEDTEKIVLQLESNYLDVFFGEGITKLNTIKVINNVINLDIYQNQDVIILTKDDVKFNFKGTYVSFAFRSKNYFEDIFSFYSFRILYLREQESLFYPLDSNLGNLCLPEKEGENYICNLILENKYNAFSSHFAVAGANQIEYLKINYAPYFKNGTLGEYNYSEFKYLYNITTDFNENITKFFFKLEFKRNGIKSILSAFNQRTAEDYLQIYSPRIYHLYKLSVYLNFSLTHNYTLTLKHISGWSGGISLNYVGFENIFTSRNYRGKPIAVQITAEKRMRFWCNTYEFVFFLGLSYDLKNKAIQEISDKETKSEIMTAGYFPLYYYLNITKKTNVHIDVSVRLNSYNVTMMQNNFEIKGYLVDEDTIKRKIRGETIILREDDAIKGSYSECYNFGLIQFNKEDVNNNNYALISITNKDHSKIDSYFLIELVSDEHLHRYFMPVNQYIIESSIRDTNQYYLNIKDIYHVTKKQNSTILIDFSPNYEDLQLNFEQKDIIVKDFYNTGFHKYRIITSNDWIVYFNITNPNKRKDANYILRYFYTSETGEYNYTLDKNYLRSDNYSNSENVSITLTFNNFIIYKNHNEEGRPKDDITFHIHAYLYPKNTYNKELVNVSTLIHREYLYHANTESVYKVHKQFQLYFPNILRKHNYIYDLQLKISTYILDNIFNEEFLTFTNELDLRDIELKNEDSSNTLTYVLLGVIAAILIVLIVLFFVYRKVRRDNSKLQENILSITYATGIEKNVLKEEKKKEKEEDYETTFI